MIRMVAIAGCLLFGALIIVGVGQLMPVQAVGGDYVLDDLVAAQDAEVEEIPPNPIAVLKKPVAGCGCCGDCKVSTSAATKAIMKKATADPELERILCDSTCCSVPKVGAAVVAPVRSVVQAVADVATPSNVAKGHWSYPGTIGGHLVSDHGVAVEGLSREQQLTLHDSLHETQTVYGTPARAAVMQSSCPGGVCPTSTKYSVRRGLFRRR